MAASRHWARKLTAVGHEVCLIPPRYGKPCLKRGKNDRNDADAICEAAGRPGMRFVLVKTEDQPAQAMVMKVRNTLLDRQSAQPPDDAIDTRPQHAVVSN